ncbi:MULTISPECIES: GntR family transcriptional regulator [Enterobacter]|jgi:GntR family transcriptional regulator, colanic acid and biofilm gene transcriptional regulator|uniref:GntR family transcriptional regulator n=1 Tax=Enterobacter cancerogenus TaxID=69218 RepID=A0AAP8TEX2_9ENTR|nr:GntR family transcriptional regulator [Enterobacter cancerogenus]AUJ81560.1 GntR family transcriptional regulator [Enterobacter cancerogenus]EFC56771.1 transcriptional regulator, GntR family [Enterobacter cancerogenus ATCC 35316]EKS7426255.1 GntR family transcriptional regulator [Enterobacter cancerogenus]PNF11026.1 FCD domain-containing protein [Enterobacter cancerogenus]QGG08016.1 GntR family transcriptional regulator [Enterobacter cancerogenus]
MLDLDHLEKAQRISLTMQVEISLKGALITGSLKPGARLITKEIADKLGTSITPVREALLRLVSAGALHATPAQAFLVPEVTLERYKEINTIRKQLEPMAVAAACGHMSEAKVNALREMSEAFHEAMRQGNVQRALHANRVFRFSLYQYAEMPTLSALIEQLWVRIGPCINYLHDEFKDVPVDTYHYAELLDALERKDVVASQKAIDKLIDEADALLQRQYFS